MSRELIEAAKAVIADRDHLGAMFEWEGNDVLTRPNAVRWQAFVAAVRAAEAAPAADTVAVPVAAIRRLKSTVSSFGVGIPDWARRARKAADDITKLLPPPPAPEPSEELVAEWEREAAEYAKATHTEGGFIRPVIRGYVAARRAEWAKKGGG